MGGRGLEPPQIRKSKFDSPMIVVLIETFPLMYHLKRLVFIFGSFRELKFLGGVGWGPQPPFWKNLKFFRFPCCSTREDISIDVSFTTVGLILTNLG